MAKKVEKQLSKKMKPIRIGLSALILSSYLVSLSPVVEATVVDSSKTNETQLADIDNEKMESDSTEEVVSPEKSEGEDSSIEESNSQVEESEPSLPSEEDVSENLDEQEKASEDVPVKNEDLSIQEEADDSLKSEENENSINEAAETEEIETNGLLMNADFSKIESKTDQWTGNKPQNWTLWIPSNITTTDYVAEVSEEGQLVLASETDPFRAAVYQDLEVTGGERYKLTFDVKTEDKVSFARIRIMEKKGDEQITSWYTTNYHGTNDWQTVEKTFTVSPDADNIRVELFFEEGTGTVWYDNVQVEPQEVVEVPEEDAVEESIGLTEKGIYLTQNKEYEYVIKDTSIAENKNGLIYPNSIGSTTVEIVNEAGEIVREIPLEITPYMESSFDELLQTWNGINAGNDYFDSANSTMLEQNNKLDHTVEQIVADYQENANEDYLWSDVTDYTLSPSLTTSYRKLESVAKQITQPESVFYQSEPAVRMVKESLKWLHDKVYNVDSEINGNWWDYEIGTPRAINNTLSLMRPYFSQEEIIKYTDPINKFVPDPYYFRSTQTPFKALGGNLIDMGRVKIIQGALREDDSIVKEAIESLSQAFQFTESGEGFYKDGSYIDHTNVAYNGAYGNVMIDGLSQLLPVVLQTGYLDESKLDTLYQFIDRAFLPLMYKGEMMELTRGRSISRVTNEPHIAGGEVIRGIMRIAEVSDPSIQSRLYSIVKTFVEQDTYYDIFNSLSSYKDIHLMQEILKDDAIQTIQRETSLNIFNNMDKVTYQNSEKDFAIGISMYSDLTQNFEYMNDENARGWHTADGAIYFYNDDLSHYSDNYWPTVNAQFLPGTTVVLEDRENGSGQTTLPSAFVGGTKLDENSATVAMDFTNWNETLSAKKSWFILGDKIVFLGSDINHNSESPAVTTIENRKLNSEESYEIYVNGEKLNISEGNPVAQNASSLLISNPNNPDMNIGYAFLEDTEINILNETRTGSWKEINASQPDTPYANEFMTVYQDHKTENDTYAYVMYPNITSEELNKTSNDKQIKVLRNDKLIQAVYDKGAEKWGVVLYENEPFEVEDGLRLEEQGVYSISSEKDHYSVSYYDPINNVNDEYTIEKSSEEEKQPVVSYSTHVQSDGWLNAVKNGEISGTEGAAKRLEAIKVSLADLPYEGSVEYQTHVQSDGWIDWVKDGEMSGTEGQAKRLEAIRIKLTGEMAEHFDIYYRVHSQTYGWLDWAKNGEEAGTEGLAKRLEAVEIRLVKKGEAAPGNTENSFITSKPVVTYSTHVQSVGWQGEVSNGQMSGTQGQALRLEGIRLNASDPAYEGGLEYRTHIQSVGWQDWRKDGELSGTEGQARRLEAIQIRLNDEMAKQYDVYYRVHAQTFGWMSWAKNGEAAGTEGLAKRLEGIEVVLVKKGEKAPGNTARPHVKSNPNVNYTTHIEKSGWQKTVSNGTLSGTTGKALRLEGIMININDPSLSGDIQYRTHVQSEGWQGWKQDWQLSGTQGKARRLEAIQIKLTDEMAQFYDVYYRVHAESYGWLGWAKNGESAGTEGLAKRLEGIEVKLVLKGNKAPGSTQKTFIKK